MKGVARRMARLGAIGFVAMLGLPVLLLVPAAVLDRAPIGTSRASLFPMALAVWDPFVWICVRNSVLNAAIVAGGSLVLGLALARTVGPWRFWGRPPLAALAWLSLAAPPVLAAVGLKGLLPPTELGRRIADATGHALFLDVPWAVWLTWNLLAWSGLAWGTTLVALSVKAALGRVDPGWADAGRALGATRWRAWRQLVWPIVRPQMARTLAAVFAASLLEPGAPLVLGLRRTLPYALVEAAIRDVAPNRTAALALIGLTLALLGRLLIRGWGGPYVDVDPRDRDDRPARASWRRAIVSILGLSAWIAFALAPLYGLFRISFGTADPASERGWVVALAAVVYGLLDPDTSRLWRNSLLLGLLATALAAGLVALLRRRPAGGVRPIAPRPSLLVLGLEQTPPLVLGAASALVPGLLALVGDRLNVAGLRLLGEWLDPLRWPGLLLIAATAATRLPTLARASDRAELRRRPSLSDAAQALGASRRRASKLGGGRGPGRGVLFLSFTLAATSIVPALVLAPTLRTRPVGPALIALADDPTRAATLALGAVALNLLGLAAARRSGAGPVGDWFRG
jgi:ABC-type Fe3+ transport system permease subunit